MIRISLVAPPFCDHSVLDDDNCINLKEGSTLRTLYRIIKVPFFLRPIIITNVNYERSPWGTVLQNGDYVSIFWPLSGG